jgi:hypothetical protein
MTLLHNSLLCRLGLLGLLVSLAVGCTTSSGPPSLSGNVTLDGQKVGGTIVFVGGDGKEYPGGLLNGRYLVMNVPKGDYDVIIRGMGGSGSLTPKKDKDAGGGTLGTDSQGVEPPAKYAKAGALEKVKVTGGQQTQNFTLTP